MTVTIRSWNAEHGFGFVLVNRRRALLRATAITDYAILPTGTNLLGEEVEVMQTSPGGPYGLLVTAAKLPRLTTPTAQATMSELFATARSFC